MRRSPLLISLLAVLALAAGCGEKASGPKPLPEAEISALNNAQQRIEASCAAGGDKAGIPDAVKQVSDIAKQHPDATFETGQSEQARDVNNIAFDIQRRLRDCGQEEQAKRLDPVAKQ